MKTNKIFGGILMKVRVQISDLIQYEHDNLNSIWVELGVKNSDELKKEIDHFFNHKNRLRIVTRAKGYYKVDKFVITDFEAPFHIDVDADFVLLNDYLLNFNLENIDEDIFKASYEFHNANLYEAMTAVKEHQYTIYEVESEDEEKALLEITKIKMKQQNSQNIANESFNDTFDYEKIVFDMKVNRKIIQIPNRNRTFIEFLKTN